MPAERVRPLQAPPTVFISYSREDRAFVEDLAKKLRSAGMRPWIDWNRDSHEEAWSSGMQPGDDFPCRIAETIRDCALFLLVLSAASNKSEWVNMEVAMAHHFRKRICPLSLEQEDDVSPSILPYVVRLHRYYVAAVPSWWRDFIDSLREVLRSVQEAARKHGSVTVDLTPHAGMGGQWVTNVEFARYRGTLGETTADDDLPVTGLTWREANEYCSYQGGRLPNENDDPIAPDVSSGSAAPPLEWCDGGVAGAKQLRDSATGELRGLFAPDHPMSAAGVRCLPAVPSRAPEWCAIEADHYRVGFDAIENRDLLMEHKVSTVMATAMAQRDVRAKSIQSFEIATTAVSNAEYWKFVRANPRHWPSHWYPRCVGPDREPFPAHWRALPVVNVSGTDARMYCIWKKVKLPKWYEWEIAAGGRERATYPWGNSYDSARCNSVESGRGDLVSVWEYPSSESAFGLRQMCGNVAEFVQAPTNGELELRGGSFQSPCRLWGIASAFRKVSPHCAAVDVGFRVVRTAQMDE